MLTCTLERLKRLALIDMVLIIFNVSEDTAAWLFWDTFSHYEIRFPYPFNQKNPLEFTLKCSASDTTF